MRLHKEENITFIIDSKKKKTPQRLKAAAKSERSAAGNEPRFSWKKHHEWTFKSRFSCLVKNPTTPEMLVYTTLL